MKPHLDASVVICVYNRPKQIRTCVASLLGMSAKGYEIVFVDDASTDETPQILEELATEIRSRDIDVQTVRNEVNRGVSGARNAGIDAATRSVIAFTDSDCTVEHDWLAQLVTPLTDDRISASAGLVVDDPPTNLAELAFFGSCQIGQNALQGRHLIGGNMAIRTEVLRDLRFDDELTYGCDEDDLANRLSEAGHKFASVSNAVVYHHHPRTMADYWKQAWKQGRGS
ncbi:MAG: glycosyltransferase family 2 protein, partial [Rubripirellula sp.]|nr:glycosyltransferase family 2 protein [Rubripirellula sp.]